MSLDGETEYKILLDVVETGQTRSSSIVIQILKIIMLLPRTEIEVTACGLLAVALIGATYLTPPIVMLRAFAKRGEDAKK